VRAKTMGTALGDLLGQQLNVAINPTDAFNLQTACVNWGDDGSFYVVLGGQRPDHASYYLALAGGWEHFLPVNGVSRVKVWGHRRVLHEKSDGVPSSPSYFEADIAIDTYQIQPNALFDAIPTRLRSDDLVPCTQYAPVKEELVYRTAKNFMGRVLYSPCTPCLLRDTTARALARAQAALDARAPGRGLTFQIWDAYRPYEVQKAMWAHTPDTHYVANPYTGGSSHNKGLAIDLTLVDASGKVLDMGTEFDDFSKKAHHGYKRLPKDVLANRALLKAAMEAAGFVALPTEWWHYRLPLDLPIVDLKFPCPY
jgi:D-alanyl-D-alanine dipeptidase